MYKLIPQSERHKYRCCVCGTTKSVKYLIETYDPFEGEKLQYRAYCNRCALLHETLKK